MGKKSKMKSAPIVPLSKKAAKALQIREAEIRAELERRAAEKAKRKAKKKGGKKGAVDFAKLAAEAKAERKRAKKASDEPVETVDASALGVMTIEAEAPIAAEPDAVADAAERAKPLEGDEMTAALDADLKKALAAKRAAREAASPEARAAIEAEAETVDRSDEAAVSDYNARAVKVGVRLLTSNAEREKMHKRVSSDVDKGGLVAAAEEHVEMVAEIVETDHGREIAVGTPTSDEPPVFAKPSEALASGGVLEENGNGQYKIIGLDGKTRGYTRWTTYIDCLEDKTMLAKWQKRILLEGVAVAEEGGDAAVTAAIRDLIHNRDVAIAKARKADRKGKLDHGDLAVLTKRAWDEFKKALDVVAEDLFELGGGRVKAQKGTDIHALCDLYDREGIAAVGDLLTAGQITPSDLADVEAYADAMQRLGAKVVEIERVVVNDELQVAGRLDRVVMAKLPELVDPKTGEIVRPAEARARRRVLDLKTGNVEYSLGKIAMQLEGYSGSLGYDLETGAREDLKMDRTTGILVHLPAGSGKATVHVVDLGNGRRGNKLAAEVRAHRNVGKRAINTKIDVLAALETGDES